MSSLLQAGGSLVQKATQSAALELQLSQPVSIPFQQGDSVNGILTLTVPYEMEHAGISVTLRGSILDHSNDLAYGAVIASTMQAAKNLDFI